MGWAPAIADESGIATPAVLSLAHALGVKRRRFTIMFPTKVKSSMASLTWSLAGIDCPRERVAARFQCGTPWHPKSRAPLSSPRPSRGGPRTTADKAAPLPAENPLRRQDQPGAPLNPARQCSFRGVCGRCDDASPTRRRGLQGRWYPGPPSWRVHRRTGPRQGT